MNAGEAALIGALLNQGKSLEEARGILAAAARGEQAARDVITEVVRVISQHPAAFHTESPVSSLYQGSALKFKGRQDIHEEPLYPADNALHAHYRLGAVSLFPQGDPNDELTRNMAFQPQDRMAFSPLPSQPYSTEGVALLLIIANFARTPEGQKSLERIVVKYLDSCTKIIESVEDACHSNWLTALNNQHITATIGHRIGLIDDAGYLKIMSHYQSVFDKMWQKDVALGALSGVTTLVQGSKTSITSQEAGQYGAKSSEGAAGIPALTSILTKVMAGV
jgi:hypothetical protein